MMQASAWEYRFRYPLQGFLCLLGFAAPWSLPLWNFTRNQSGVFRLANALAKPSYLHFAAYWNGVIAVMLVSALAGAVLRTWGSAYLDAATADRTVVSSTELITCGPYRFLRNPMDLGTLLTTCALAMLMRPEAGVMVLLVTVVLQSRLIRREESLLSQRLSPAYAAYVAAVPRFIPSFHRRSDPGSLHANWSQSLLSELFVIGCAVAVGGFGWSTGYGWESSIVHVMQAVLISLGASFVARAFL